MRLAFVGAGKVGVTLGKYLSTSEHCTISGYYSRNTESAKMAADFTDSKCFSDLEQLIENSDAIFLTVSDGSVRDVYEKICHYNISGKQIIHCSGSLSSQLFCNIEKYQATGLSIHPLYAFNQPYGDNTALSTAVITIEGNPETRSQILEFWKRVFEQKGNFVVFLDSAKKTKYHCAAVFSSNLFLGLLDCGVSLLEECGFSGEDALKALYPLTMNNLEKAFRVNPSQALTGPIERADVGTIEKHMDELDDETKEIYRLLSKRTLKLAKEKNPHRDYKKIEEMLK